MSKQIVKVVRVGKVPTWGGYKSNLYCKVQFTNGKLSITGVIGPRASGNADGGCGQIDMEFEHRRPEQNDKRYRTLIKPGEIDFAPGWSAEKWLQFLDVWQEWHSNDMKAGCEHQRAIGWKSYDEHPSEPCPVCGYKYGSQWLKVEVPADVLAFLQSLPDTDKQPAWV